MISKNFNRSEFACKCGCGFDTVDTALIIVMQSIRDRFGALAVSSGCRCASHNKSVGGAAKSQHLLGRAADIRPLSATAKEVADWVKSNFPKVSCGEYSTFVHIDTRTGKPWVK